jgi:hypothetical protein
MRKLSLIILALITMVFGPFRVVADSPHGKEFNLSCDLCHNSTGWTLDKSIYSFNHNKTAFPLIGQHEGLNCRACHPTLVFSEAKTECIDCHTDMHNQTVGPDCGRCHTPKSWIVENVTQMHQRSRFPLLGAHRTTDCSNCHKSASLLRFEPLGVQCIDCHLQNYNSATNPNHKAGGFSTDCIQCHPINSISWSSTNTDHSFFPLTLGHANLNCNRCHTNGTYAGISNQCVSCHQPTYAGTTNPNHQAANIPTTCADCHTTTPGWKPATFTIHNTYYALTGAHITTNCDQCHNGNYSTTANTCVGCHQANYNASENPNHVAANIPTTCNDCHTTNPGWKPATFTIHETYYPLTGAHTTTSCNQCHNGNYSNIPNTCVGCHQTDYNNTNNPPHAASQFSTDCQSCHSTAAWIPATFDHDAKYFPIYSGKHQGTWTLCTECHLTPSNYGIFSCIDCHAHSNQTEVNNSHQGVGGYSYNSLACYSCHPTGSINGAFNHNNSGFPLTGAHTTVLCSACHANGFSGTPTLCSACHTPAYNNTNNPNHTTAGIPNTCADCHTTNPGWAPAIFPNHSNYYPLTGAHASITNCEQCHNGNYTNTTPNTCVGCHQSNYNQTNNPNHTTLGLSTNCATCHTTNPGWTPATFPIHNNYWALTGAHTTTTCNQCHNGNYNTTPNTCVGCHQADYNNTNNPPHASAQFPTDCQTCHTTTAWIPSTFNHDGQYFPIYSGHHAGKWNLCADCHTNSSNYQVFSCIDCHPHNNQSQVNSDHQGVSGYSYNSVACYNCHPTGSAGKLLRPLKTTPNNIRQN